MKLTVTSVDTYEVMYEIDDDEFHDYLDGVTEVTEGHVRDFLEGDVEFPRDDLVDALRAADEMSSFVDIDAVELP